MSRRLSLINSLVHGRRDYNINDVQIHFGELRNEYLLLNCCQISALDEVILVVCWWQEMSRHRYWPSYLAATKGNVLNPSKCDTIMNKLSFSPWCEQGNQHKMTLTLWDRKRTQWATWGLIRTKRDSFWVGRLKWSHCWSQMVSFWVALRKLLPLGAKLVSFWMVWNCRVSNRLTWSQLVSFWVAYRKAPPQRAKMASFWVVWFPCG